MRPVFAVLIGLFFVSSPFRVFTQKESELGFDPRSAELNLAYRKIKDHNSSEEGLLQAIKRLRGVIEPAEFWANIANDSKYTVRHRGICTQQLVKRHIRAGMTLKQASEKFYGASWLASERTVFRFDCLGGWLPVHGIPGIDSVFRIDTPDPDKDFMISVLGRGLNKTDMFQILRGKKVGANMENKVIHDVWPRKDD
jgi:hypothetical protein